MKKAIIAVALITLVLLFCNTASASTVFEDVGIFKGAGSDLLSFEANVAPYSYVLTLKDLSLQPDLGFNALGLNLFSSDGVVGSLSGPGVLAFDPVPQQMYFLNVFGVGAGDFGAGVYGVTVNTAVPIPAAGWLLGGALIGLVGLRKRVKS